MASDNEKREKMINFFRQNAYNPLPISVEKIKKKG